MKKAEIVRLLMDKAKGWETFSTYCFGRGRLPEADEAYVKFRCFEEAARVVENYIERTQNAS